MMEYYFIECLPNSCFYCDCCHTKSYDNRYKIDGEKFCGIVNIEINDDYYDHNDETGHRPDWCPLRMIPDDCLDKMIGK